MTNTTVVAPPEETEINFATQKHGYDKDQVDRYIEMLAQAYQTAYDNYTAVRSKYTGLLEDYATLERQSKKSSSNAEAITKTLLDAEVMARNIVTTAQKEAEQIKTEAEAEAEAIKADTYMERLAAKRIQQAANESLLETISKLQDMCQGESGCE